MAIVQEQTEALLTSQHVGQSFSQFGLARDTARLSVQPIKEFIDQRAGFLLPDRTPLRGRQPTDLSLDFLDGRDLQQSLDDDW